MSPYYRIQVFLAWDNVNSVDMGSSPIELHNVTKKCLFDGAQLWSSQEAGLETAHADGQADTTACSSGNQLWPAAEIPGPTSVSRACSGHSLFNPGKEQPNYNGSWSAPLSTKPSPEEEACTCQMDLLISMGSMVFLMQMRANKSLGETRTQTHKHAVEHKLIWLLADRRGSRGSPQHCPRGLRCAPGVLNLPMWAAQEGN